jgi:2-aminoadipate transaminase
MRLNFSASGADEIREGIRRIGSVVTEQVELYESITGEHRQVTNVRPSSSAPPAGAVGSGEERPGEGSVIPFRPHER